MVLSKVLLGPDAVFGVSLLFWDLFYPLLVPELRSPMQRHSHGLFLGGSAMLSLREKSSRGGTMSTE